MNNIVRVSYQALSAVLGGTQSLHTNSFDEAIGLPTDEAVTIALRTQQLIANETGIIEHPDPLGGSYLVEEMTSDIYDSARALIQEIDRMGGSLECIKSGYQQTVIHESAWKYLKGVEDGSISVVGVNTNESNMEKEFEGQVLNPNEVTRQIHSLEKLRMERDSEEVSRALDILRKACMGSENVMEPLIHALKSEATVGEVNGIMREVFGTWTSPSGV
jgi:methylmalonyl-CoA mutase N-terminal domain/subunit